MSRQIDLQQKDPQTNSYPHTSDSRSVTANVQRSGPTSKLKKVRTSISMGLKDDISGSPMLITFTGGRTNDDVPGALHADLDYSNRHSYLSRNLRPLNFTGYQLRR